MELLGQVKLARNRSIVNSGWLLKQSAISISALALKELGLTLKQVLNIEQIMSLSTSRKFFNYQAVSKAFWSAALPQPFQ